MRLYLKIILIIFVVLLSIFIFFFFIIYNFPYDSLVRKANFYLKKEADISLELTSVKYHIPNIWYITGLIVHLPEGSGKVSIPEIKIKLNVLNISRLKRFELISNNIEIVNNNLFNANLSRLKISGSFVFPDVRDDPFKGMRNIRVALSNGNVKKIEYSGFKISNFKIIEILIDLMEKNEKFNLEKGTINIDILKGNLKGYISKNYLDVGIKLEISDDFFIRYPDLKPILGSIINQNEVALALKGNPKSPKLIKK